MVDENKKKCCDDFAEEVKCIFVSNPDLFARVTARQVDF